MSVKRSADVDRETGETEVSVGLVVDGRGEADVDTGLGFLDHMLESLAKHGLFDLGVQADGDVDKTGDHHTVEDVGITLGLALDDALGDRTGINRFADSRAPLDEAVSSVVLDISGRAYADIDLGFEGEGIADVSTDSIHHFFRSVAMNSGITLHIEGDGEDDHHIAESAFKAFALALDHATQKDDRRDGVPSTKGKI